LKKYTKFLILKNIIFTTDQISSPEGRSKQSRFVSIRRVVIKIQRWIWCNLSCCFGSKSHHFIISSLFCDVHVLFFFSIVSTVLRISIEYIYRSWMEFSQRICVLADGIFPQQTCWSISPSEKMWFVSIGTNICYLLH
jgi:hypothetical protein